MYRFSSVLAAILVLLFCAIPSSSTAQTEMPPDEHVNGGLGFHNIEAPVGIRWWFAGQKVGLDAGFGFQSTQAPSYSDEKLTGWAIAAGVPIVMKSWSRVHVMFRPGLLYESQQVEITSPPTPFDTDDETSLSVTGEIEAEVFLMENFSVSASHGLGFFSFDPVGPGDSITSFGTLGNNFSHVGFHVYFFGGH